ncbi:hypothetical protein TNCV_3516301 [Trichonephila clavipes]|nr:hypothetical protein TNCV_3516301 [Trichonephila clavipes]
MTWTTPELAPPLPNWNIHTTPTEGHFSSRQIYRASLPYTAGLQWYWARTRDKASVATIRCTYHSATAAIFTYESRLQIRLTSLRTSRDSHLLFSVSYSSGESGPEAAIIPQTSLRLNISKTGMEVAVKTFWFGLRHHASGSRRADLHIFDAGSEISQRDPLL